LGKTLLSAQPGKLVLVKFEKISEKDVKTIYLWLRAKLSCI